MKQDKIKALEVRPDKKGRYFVTMYRYTADLSEHLRYFNRYTDYDGEKWDYGVHKDKCYVCAIHEKLENE